MVMAEGKAPLLAVDDALQRLLDGVEPLASEAVDLSSAHGRVLAQPIGARLTQPPFDASAMDGYALRAIDAAAVPATFAVIGDSAAGRGFAGSVGAGQAVRIFTGAPIPAGADAVVIQEDTARNGDTVTVNQATFTGENIRGRGKDFASGQPLFPAGHRLTARDLMLAASSGHGSLAVHRRPRVAILATGDELVPPGATPGPDQIVSSIPVGLAAMIVSAGGEPIHLGIARDTLPDLDAKIVSAADADILVTIGGASVGDHDLVQKALTARGLSLAFWRIAMRPGKPLMFGKLGSQRVLGLPGNPVSATLCAQIFLLPLIRALQGGEPTIPGTMGVLSTPLTANGPRQHYIRARIVAPGTPPTVEALPSQDSSLVATLARADCLIVQPANGSALAAGALAQVLALEG
jgi:molybdopterin molybdotransferase